MSECSTLRPLASSGSTTSQPSAPVHHTTPGKRQTAPQDLLLTSSPRPVFTNFAPKSVLWFEAVDGGPVILLFSDRPNLREDLLLWASQKTAVKAKGVCMSAVVAPPGWLGDKHTLHGRPYAMEADPKIGVDSGGACVWKAGLSGKVRTTRPHRATESIEGSACIKSSIMNSGRWRRPRVDFKFRARPLFRNLSQQQISALRHLLNSWYLVPKVTRV